MSENKGFPPGALPLAILMSPRWGFSVSRGVAPGYINLALLGLKPGALPQAILISPRWGFSVSWGVALGYINLAPLGLKPG
ncbi:MAG: hypothetical protein DRR08_29120, partial [Candidatus Parabeggiatoa sp. nov. 2]